MTDAPPPREEQPIKSQIVQLLNRRYETYKSALDFGENMVDIMELLNEFEIAALADGARAALERITKRAVTEGFTVKAYQDAIDEELSRLTATAEETTP